MIGAILFVAGSLSPAAAPNVEVLLVSRVLLGLAVGVASYTAPLYLSEIAPEKIRGSMISMYQLMITIGILGAYLSDTAFSYSGAWRWMLGVIIIPAILLLIGVFFLPDSPRWLPPNAVSSMPNACCCACAIPAPKRKTSWMKSAKA
jgi:SP family galactose:H+ symporter-like MFS transporter